MKRFATRLLGICIAVLPFLAASCGSDDDEAPKPKKALKGCTVIGMQQDGVEVVVYVDIDPSEAPLPLTITKSNCRLVVKTGLTKPAREVWIHRSGRRRSFGIETALIKPGQEGVDAIYIIQGPPGPTLSFYRGDRVRRVRGPNDREAFEILSPQPDGLAFSFQARMSEAATLTIDAGDGKRFSLPVPKR